VTRPRRKKERKKNAVGTKNRTHVARLTGGHADHSAENSFVGAENKPTQ